MMTLGQLIGAGVAPTQARTMLAPLQATCSRFDISSPDRMAAFVGQLMVESAGFTHFEENLYYSTPSRIMAIFPSRVTSIDQATRLARNPQALANCVYAGKNGNGNPLTGDGWAYRGRGGIMLSGKGNYADAEADTGRPYLTQPDLVAQPPDAMLTAGWYWFTHKLSLLADSWQIGAITRAVNGPGMIDRDLRQMHSDQGRTAFSMP